MASYRIHRIKDTPGENFRWMAHTGGLTIVKARDYEADGEVEASTPYGVWKALTFARRPLRPGDLLETVIGEAIGGELKIAKYIGFEPAAWWTPEEKPSCELAAVTARPEPAREPEKGQPIVQGAPAEPKVQRGEQN